MGRNPNLNPLLGQARADLFRQYREAFPDPLPFPGLGLEPGIRGVFEEHRYQILMRLDKLKAGSRSHALVGAMCGCDSCYTCAVRFLLPRLPRNSEAEYYAIPRE